MAHAADTQLTAGFVVPRLRGAYTDGSSLALAFDAPNSRMWVEAGAGMPRRARARSPRRRSPSPGAPAI